MIVSSLLSFLLPSYIAVCERILVSTSFPFDLNILSNFQVLLNNMAMDMKINTPRDSPLLLALIALGLSWCTQISSLLVIQSMLKLL